MVNFKYLDHKIIELAGIAESNTGCYSNKVARILAESGQAI